MIKETIEKKFPSELRFDLVSRDWVVIATGRAQKPTSFKKTEKAQPPPKENCPFCHLETQEKPTLIIAEGKSIKEPSRIPINWQVAAFPNKYPAFLPSSELQAQKEGEFYKKMKAVGFHEVVATRDHEKHLALLSEETVAQVIEVYLQRYLDLMAKKFVNHIAIFHNQGKEAGASIFHPHSQIITTPLIDSDLKKALLNSKRYYKTKGKCVYCAMNEWELKEKKRIVFENEEFLVLCPFASKVAFEMIISPKKHSPYFERISENQKKYLAQALKTALFKIYKGLGDPAYNFYLHTSPADGKNYPYYHWHFTILPKAGGQMAGFEMGTRMEISTIEPEKAAEYLRNQ
jgi:UDPglucose--hexose-1-phosphate uridylyltransferase